VKNFRKELKVDVLTRFGQVTSGIHQMKIEMSGLNLSGQTVGLVALKEFDVNIPNLEMWENQTTKKIIIERIKGENGVNIETSQTKDLFKQIDENRKRELYSSRQD